MKQDMVYLSREWLKQDRCLYFAFSQVWLNGACFRLGHFVSVGRWRCGEGVRRGLCNDPATGNTHRLFTAFCMYSAAHSSGAVWESRWPSWAGRPNEPSGFRGRKAILNHAHALVSACPEYVNRHPRTLSNTTYPFRWHRSTNTQAFQTEYISGQTRPSGCLVRRYLSGSNGHSDRGKELRNYTHSVACCNEIFIVHTETSFRRFHVMYIGRLIGR